MSPLLPYAHNTVLLQYPRDRTVVDIQGTKKAIGVFLQLGILQSETIYLFTLLFFSSRLSITMAPVGKKSKRRTPRQNSNVFAMFTPQQIIEFREAFSMIDTDHDGYVCAEDLEEAYVQILGLQPTPGMIQNMLGDSTSSINFTIFLTLMAEKLSGTDPEPEILQAFAAFDDDGKGYINADDLRECMTTMGDRFTDEEVDVMFKGCPVDDYGNFNYREFVRVLKHGD